MDLLNYLPSVPDFPKPGIMFKDISPLLADSSAFSYAIDQLHNLSTQYNYTYVLGIESRGFIFASALAKVSGKGLILARKPGKLPSEVYSEQYGLEYGSDCLELQKSLLPSGAKVLLIDDVLATGGTLIAAANLVRQAGSEVSGSLVLLEITDLGGGDKLSLKNIGVKSLIQI